MSDDSDTNQAFGSWPDYDACVLDVSQAGEIDDPEAYCASIQNAVDKGEIGPGDKVMSTPTVMFMSLVETPAVQDSLFGSLKTKSKMPDLQSKGFIPFLQLKGDPDTGDVDLDAIFKKEHVVFAPALIPGKKDGNGEICFEEQIVKAAIDYMENGRLVDENHDFKETENLPVFNQILKQPQTFIDFEGKEHNLPKGSWVPGLKIKNIETWERIQNKEITGFSIAGNWKLYEVKNKKELGPGGHTPDGTGPYGAGAGPGNGTGDGSGLEAQDLSTAKDLLEQTILDMVQAFELNGGVRIQSVELDRGEWGEETWEEHALKPVRGATVSALVKSQSNKNSKDVLEMEQKEFDDYMKVYESAKANEEEAKKKAEDEKALKEDLETLKTELKETKKLLDALNAKAEDEEEDDKEDSEEDEEDKKAEDEEEDDKEDYEDDEEEKKKESDLKSQLKDLEHKRKSKKIKRLKTETKPKDDGVADDGNDFVDLNKKALKTQHKGKRGFKELA